MPIPIYNTRKFPIVLADTQGSLDLDAASVISITQAAAHIIDLSATSAISLTQAADRVAAITSLDASSTLSMTDEAGNNSYALSAENTIALTQDETVTGPSAASAANSVSMTVTTDWVIGAFGRFASSTIVFTGFNPDEIPPTPQPGWDTVTSSIKNLYAQNPDQAGSPPESLLLGFTDDWSSFGYLAQTYDLDASSTIVLTSTTPQPTGKRSVFAENTIIPLDFADNNVKTRAPTTSIIVSQAADVDLIKIAASALSITQSAIQGTVALFAENTLALDQIGRPNPLTRFATTTIDSLTVSTESSIKNLAAENTLVLSHDNNVLRPYRVDATSEVIGVSDDIFIPPAGPIIPGEPFGLEVEATVNVNPVRHPTTLINFGSIATVVHIKFDAINLTASTLVGLTDKANLSIAEAASSSLTLTVSSNANLNTTDALTEIDGIADSVTLSINRATTPAENVLTLKHAVGFSLVRDTTECDYTPFVSESDADTTPPRPVLPEPRVPELPGVRFRLVYPPFDTGTTVDQLDLRAPEFGNRERLEATRIQRETTGGTLIVFADPIWPKVHSLTMTFAALKTEQARGLLDFIERWVGQEIGLYDYEGRIWKGIITNPDEAVTQDGRESFSASLEIEAERVHQLNRVALSNLGVADVAGQDEALALSTIGATSQADYTKFPVAPSGSGIDISGSADYTIVPAGPGSSAITPTQFATRNSFFYESASSIISLGSIGAELDFDDFGTLIHNWDAENTSGLSDTDPVVSLGDLGSSPVVLNSTAGLRPIVRDSVLNGRRVIEFRHSGGTQRLLSASNVPMYDVTNKTSTIFIVMIVREALSAGNEVIIGNNTDKLMLGGSTSTHRPVALLSGESTVALETPTSVLGNGTTQLLVLRRNGNNVLFRRNKTTEDGTTFSTNPTPANEQLRVGGFSGAGNSVDQDMAQVLVYNDALSINDIQTIEGLLAAKWGV